MIRIVYKHIGETPLEALKRHTNEKATFAGRLDPMAEGKLLILTGKDILRKNEFLHLDKAYVVEVLFDITTDTGDVLGIPTLSQQQTRVPNNLIQQALSKEIGAHMRAYPAFSSKPVAGKPLFMYALEGTLDSISIPTHTETVYRAELIKTTSIASHLLHAHVQTLLQNAPTSDDPRKHLGKDFRQNDIREKWTELTKHHQVFQVATIKITCASGTYMRTLAKRLGEAFGTNALALSIKRTQIGTYAPPLPFLLPIRLTKYLPRTTITKSKQSV